MRILAGLLVLVLLSLPAHAQGMGVTIAVLDTGVDANHPELAGRVTRESFVTYGEVPGIPLPDPGAVQPDPDGHGTATASVAAGTTLGVAGAARVLDLQVAAAYTGVVDPAAENAAVRAVDWMLQQSGEGAPRVAVFGFADAGISAEGGRTLAAQAKALYDAGIVVVVPAAAEFADLHQSPYVLTVAGDAPCGEAELGAKPDLAAPADGIEVATPGQPGQSGGTARDTGTHLAAAQVAGAAARMLEARPALPLDALFAILRATANDVAPAGPDTCTGFGSLDVDAAVAATTAWVDPFTPPEASGRDIPGPALGVLFAALALVLRRR